MIWFFIRLFVLVSMSFFLGYVISMLCENPYVGIVVFLACAVSIKQGIINPPPPKDDGDPGE